ncbi:hypothetical protein pb186bvf_005625 [Paramecium bursaria]
MLQIIKNLNSLQFENNKSGSKAPRKVIGYVYSEVQPEQKENPQLIAYSQKAFSLINVELDPLLKENVEILAGNLIPQTAKPVANCYCGYQFGNWASQLGDGRAISLGDVNGYDLQLKGAGLTPYSRFADGKAVIRSSIREYLCSEALYALGIPTTRAASLVITDTLAARDMFYNGQVKQERCAVVLRMAPTFLRFGSFEIERDLNPKNTLVPLLWDYVKRYFQTQQPFQEIILRTAKLVALWQCYGFCHGVLNTDNMSILGLTIDYGPFGFMEYFDKNYICNHSDNEGRYSYTNQPAICQWNLKKLAAALEVVKDKQEMLDQIDELYWPEYNKWYYFTMLKRIGLAYGDEPINVNKSQKILIDQLFEVLDFCQSNFTKVFHVLNKIKRHDDSVELLEDDNETIYELISLSSPPQVYLEKKKPKVDENQLNKILQLVEMQPGILLSLGVDMNYLNQQKQVFDEYKIIKNQSQEERLQKCQEKWINWIIQYKEEKHYQVDKINPYYILTNNLIQMVIDKTEAGDYDLLKKVQQAIENPFEKNAEMDELINQVPYKENILFVQSQAQKQLNFLQQLLLYYKSFT